jgi:membrane associated rhomboid family serine protease
VIGVGATTLLAAASSRQYLFNVPLGLLTRDKQLWRLATHHFVFGNSSELFVGILLLFYTSIHIERVFGSVKYAVREPGQIE